MFHKLHTQFIFQIFCKQFYWINYFMLNWKYFNFIWWPLNRWPFDVEQSVMYFIRRAWLVCKVYYWGYILIHNILQEIYNSTEIYSSLQVWYCFSHILIKIKVKLQLLIKFVFIVFICKIVSKCTRKTA